MNIHKENAKKALKQICNFLNFKCSSELIIDNDQNANHCKDINCGYLKNSPLAKQPCTCKNKKYIRLVNIAFNKNDTDLYRLYYQLGHEIGHQYFDAMEVNILKNEILACYLSIVCIMKFIGGEKAKNYIQQCIQSSDNIYKFAMLIAYEAYFKWDGSIDKRFILSNIEMLLKDKYNK